MSDFKIRRYKSEDGEEKVPHKDRSVVERGGNCHLFAVLLGARRGNGIKASVGSIIAYIEKKHKVWCNESRRNVREPKDVAGEG